MKTRITKTIQSLTCAVLAAAMLFSGTMDVQAAYKGFKGVKTVTLDSSCSDVLNIGSSATKMMLSEDGKTLICLFSPEKKDGTEKTSINLKSALPANILEKFEDGEVYLYERYNAHMSSSVNGVKSIRKLAEDGYDSWVEEHHYSSSHHDGEAYDCEEKANTAKETAAAFKKKLDKSIKYNNVTMVHKDSSSNTGKITEHTTAIEENHKGVYVLTWDNLLSSAKGTGKLKTMNAVYAACYAQPDAESDALYKTGYEDRFYLADKNGNEVVNIVFVNWDYVYSEVTCSLGEDLNTYVLGSGKTLSKKISWSGIWSCDYSTEVHYAGPITIKKDGTVKAKKGKYGVAIIDDGGASYFIFVTDGSSKMLKALKKKMKVYGRQYNPCTLTINKDGSYTIKKIEHPWW